MEMSIGVNQAIALLERRLRMAENPSAMFDRWMLVQVSTRAAVVGKLQTNRSSALNEELDAGKMLIRTSFSDRLAKSKKPRVKENGDLLLLQTGLV